MGSGKVGQDSIVYMGTSCGLTSQIEQNQRINSTCKLTPGGNPRNEEMREAPNFELLFHFKIDTKVHVV